MQISIIAAISQNNIIGLNNKMPWHLSEDLKRFKQLTMGNAVIMGRKTYQGLGKPLKDRINIVISKDTSHIENEQENLFFVGSIEKALELAKEEEEIFIIGGASIYEQTIDIADKLCITRIEKDFAGDTFFPQINWGKWNKVSKERHFSVENNFYYSYLIYELK